jgi:hypothetical protein
MERERELVLEAVGEAFNDFVHYHRKLDKALPWNELARLVREGRVTKDDIVNEFRRLVQQWDVSER